MTTPSVYKDVAWFPEDLEDTDRWIHVLTDAEVADVDRALRYAQDAGRTIETLTRDTFPLQVMGDTLQLTMDQLENGLGCSCCGGFRWRPTPRTSCG